MTKKISEGYVPPQAVDVEESVLGELLLYHDYIDIVSEFLSPEHFYDEQNALIYETILSVKSEDKKPDMLVVTQKLIKQGQLDKAGGTAKLAYLTHKTGAATNTEYHARIILEKYLRRAYIEFANQFAKSCYDETEDIFDTIDSNRIKYENIDAQVVDESSMLFAWEIANKKIETLSKLVKEKVKVTGLQTGYEELDKETGGFQEGDMIVWAGRPSMGKTLSAKEIVLSTAKNLKENEVIVIFSLEVSGDSLVTNMLSSIASIPLEKIKQAELNEEDILRLKAAQKQLKSMGILIDETSALAVEKMKSKLTKLSKRYIIKLVVADYLQLFTTTTRKGNREQEIAHISRTIKSTAKMLRCPYIALAQLSRGVDKQADKKPQLSDLRESGGIEQDADLVIFPFRPVYYGDTEYEINGQVVATDNLGILICRKHRNGRLFEVPVEFDLSIQKMYSYGQMYAQGFNPYKPMPMPKVTEIKSQFDDFTFGAGNFKGAESKDIQFDDF